MTEKPIQILIHCFFLYYKKLNLFYKKNLYSLTNNKIVFLPQNAKFVFQLLNQKMIKPLKTHYKTG